MTFEEKMKILDFIGACMAKAAEKTKEANKYVQMANEIAHKLNEKEEPKIKLVVDNGKETEK